VVAALLRRSLPSDAGKAREVRETDLEVMAYALVGAAESLADWLADHPTEDPDRLATRLMDASWLGAGPLPRGKLSRPPAA
jgi:hypothetical protein